MIEKITTVRNPLTIIAMFAAIVEISGTAVLPFLAEIHQGVYIWFLMLFPLLLVTTFFLTLNFNHRVLYAPSDYRDEKNFVQSFAKQTPNERIQRFAEVVSDAADPIESKSPIEASEHIEQSFNEPRITVELKKKQHSEIRARYSLAEQLVMSKLSSEFQTSIERDINFSPKGANGVKVAFDGVAVFGDSVSAIEVKYFPTGRVQISSLEKVLAMTEGVAQSLKDQDRKFKLIVAVVIENDAQISAEEIQERIGSIGKGHSYPIDVRVYRLGDLESSLGLS